MNRTMMKDKSYLRQYVFVISLLMVSACSTAFAQRHGSAVSTISITARVVGPKGVMGTNTGFISSRFQDRNPMGDSTDEAAKDDILDGGHSVTPAPTLWKSASSMTDSHGQVFRFEDLPVDSSEIISAALGSDGNLYMQKSMTIDQKRKKNLQTATSELIIVSVTD